MDEKEKLESARITQVEVRLHALSLKCRYGAHVHSDGEDCVSFAFGAEPTWDVPLDELKRIVNLAEKARAYDKLQARIRQRGWERVRITKGAWKDSLGWITGPKNEVDGFPIKLDSGFNICWFESEFERIES